MIIGQTGKFWPNVPSSETSQKQLIQIIIYYVRGHAYSALNIVDRKNVENVNEKECTGAKIDKFYFVDKFSQASGFWLTVR